MLLLGGSEPVAVIAFELVPGHDLRRCVLERVASFVPTVGLEVGQHTRAGVRHGMRRVVAAHDRAGTLDVVRGEVGTEVRTVTEDRSVLHEPVLLEQQLALEDVLAGEQDGAVRGADGTRNRRVFRVHAIREVTEDGKADDEREQRDFNPNP